MPERQEIVKTHKLFINGQFPRSESGRSLVVRNASGEVTAHACLASRKDLRDAVVAARAAQDGWSRRSAYNRGQILYRMGEMLEGKRDEFERLLSDAAQVGTGAAKKPRGKKSTGLAPADEVTASIDRLIAFAGWADKYSQVLGCHNHVNGPYYNFTVAEATGVVAMVCPDRPALLGLISLLAPALCAGNCAVVISGEAAPLAACVLGEVCATSDVPAGVINILTGSREELLPHLAEHRDIDAVVGAGLDAGASERLRMGSANNLKRVKIHELEPSDWLDDERCESPWWIEATVEMKTIWHPSAS
ncbi:MAG: aldehyde dehydrogenase family protein [Phycisphaerales bacterium]